MKSHELVIDFLSSALFPMCCVNEIIITIHYDFFRFNTPSQERKKEIDANYMYRALRKRARRRRRERKRKNRSRRDCT